jgi:alpha-L-fucosidase
MMARTEGRLLRRRPRKRTIDKKTYYDWPTTWDMIRTLQPNASIFSDVGPDIRWVGNEKGFANETCWATFEPVGVDGGVASPGDVRTTDSGAGTRHGSKWIPAECDVSIRPGWFWHEAENSRVKTPDQLLDLYYKSVGRGASFLLNIPPDQRGLLHETDVASLQGFGNRLRGTFRANLAAKAKKASSERAGQTGDCVMRNRTLFVVIGSFARIRRQEPMLVASAKGTQPLFCH